MSAPGRSPGDPSGLQRAAPASSPSLLAQRLEALGESSRRIRRRPLFTLLALMLTSSALALTLATAVILMSLMTPWQRLNMPAQAVVFVASSARSADINALRSHALEVAGVVTVEHPSREVILAELGRRTPGGVPADLQASALPETLLVQFAHDLDPATAEAAATALRKLPRVDLVEFDSVAYQRWHGALRVGASIGLAAAITLVALSAGLLMLLPAQIAATPRDEAQLRALLGATGADIRRPGAYAGALFGATSALLGIGALMLGQQLLEPLLASIPPWIDALAALDLPPWPAQAAVVAVCALLAGAAGALAARGRH